MLMSSPISDQLVRLETMPLTNEEYHVLQTSRRMVVVNTLGLGLVGGIGGRVVNSMNAPMASKMSFTLLFGSVGAMIGLGLGVQFAIQTIFRENPNTVNLRSELSNLQNLVSSQNNLKEED
jgi:disulfide bond formation protein DsbB